MCKGDARALMTFEERSAARDSTNRESGSTIQRLKWFHTSRVLFKPGDVLVPRRQRILDVGHFR